MKDDEAHQAMCVLCYWSVKYCVCCRHEDAGVGADGGAVGPDPCSPSRKGHHMYEDPYEEGPGAVASAPYPSASATVEGSDYDEPWEWSATTNSHVPGADGKCGEKWTTTSTKQNPLYDS